MCNSSIEVWKKYKEYNEYEISNLGNVRTLKYGKIDILKPNITRGYNRVKLRIDGKNKDFYVHRMVAEMFIPNPNNLPQIDHINTIRTDNRVENLRWCTAKENANNPLTLNKRKKYNYC